MMNCRQYRQSLLRNFSTTKVFRKILNSLGYKAAATSESVETCLIELKCLRIYLKWGPGKSRYVRTLKKLFECLSFLRRLCD